MENMIQLVKDAVIRLLKGAYPSASVYGEEISRTKEDEADTEWFYVDVRLTEMKTESKLQSDVSLLVLIDYHHPVETNRHYISRFTELDSLFRPAFSFYDGQEERKITVGSMNMNISGKLLHVSFPLQFIISREDPERYELMGELVTDIREEA